MQKGEGRDRVYYNQNRKIERRKILQLTSTIWFLQNKPNQLVDIE